MKDKNKIMFIGFQKEPGGGKVPLFNILCGPCRGMTVSDSTLAALGILTIIIEGGKGKSMIYCAAKSKCPTCHRSSVLWRKHDFYRESDGAFDWRLEVFCPWCGEVDDQETVAQVYEQYYARLRRQIRDQQDAVLDRYLGRISHKSLARMIEEKDEALASGPHESL